MLLNRKSPHALQVREPNAIEIEKSSLFSDWTATSEGNNSSLTALFEQPQVSDKRSTTERFTHAEPRRKKSGYLQKIRPSIGLVVVTLAANPVKFEDQYQDLWAVFAKPSR